MGESGPEAIMPLTSIGGRLGVKAIGSGGAKVVYNIDARGAAAGVEHQIMRVLRDVEDRAVSRAVNLVADSRRRGGVFGDAI
jgi:phage-related minor tail protein